MLLDSIHCDAAGEVSMLERTVMFMCPVSCGGKPDGNCRGLVMGANWPRVGEAVRPPLSLIRLQNKSIGLAS